MKINSVELIRLTFDALENFWDEESTLIFAPCATIEEWKNFYTSLSNVIDQTVSYDAVMVSGGEEEVTFEQREDNGKLFIAFDGEIMYSQWSFSLTVNDAKEFLDYIENTVL